MSFLGSRAVRALLLGSSLFVGACSWLEEDTPPGAIPPDPFFGGGFGGGTGDTRSLEPLTLAADPPPPIAGGTLYYSASQGLVLASDPDRDAVFVIDSAATGTAQPLANVALEPGDEPGRIGEAGGRFWVVLRSGGAVAAIDPADWSVVRHPVCPVPRGVAGEGEVVHIACESGDLVTLNAATGAEVRRVFVEPDLRDVVVATDGLYVDRFRRPVVLRLDASGAVVGETPLAPVNGFEPSVAYQMIAHPDEGVMVVHEYGNVTGVPVDAQPNAYGQGGCSAINLLGIARVVGDVATQGQYGAVTLPVSFAVDETGIAVVDAGALNDGSFTSDFMEDDGLLFGQDVDAQFDVGGVADHTCGLSARSLLWQTNGLDFQDGRQILAVVSTPLGLWVQTRDPWQVVGPAVEVSLPGPNRKDTGHDLFHERAGASIACASCHAEGGDDGLVWQFDGVVARRTHDLRGGILATAPFHWDGARVDMSAIMNDAFSTRMSGPFLDAAYTNAVASWVDSVEMPAAPVGASEADVLAGKAIFERADVGCASCHAGALFTNDQNVDVGTGGAFQVPRLAGVGRRGRYLHDGCAASLEAAIRAESCSGTGGAHGDVGALSTTELGQLVAYLRSL